MRVFLSHSSAQRELVAAVHAALEPNATWIDRAEIEWGDIFLQKIEEGIEFCTDFVLFWSHEAARSEWVRLEMNMAFIQALSRKAIRLRVIRLDDRAIPLHLQPYQTLVLDKSPNPLREILDGLVAILQGPVQFARSWFVNRHKEMAQIEAAVDDPECRAVWIHGFAGIGKRAVVREGLKRIFEGASLAPFTITDGTGAVELAIALASAAKRDAPSVGLPPNALETEMRLSFEKLIRDKKFPILSGVQNWLTEDGDPDGPLRFVLSLIADSPALAGRPLFLTSTRRPFLPMAGAHAIRLIRLGGLGDEHVGALVRNWFFIMHVRDLPTNDAKRIAPHLHGHPMAARLAAGLLGEQGAEFLEAYPQQLIKLRRDLARVLLMDLKLSDQAQRLMETLTLAGAGLPPSVIANTGFSDEDFQLAVSQCASAGLITADRNIETHPLIRDHYWHKLHRSEFRERALVMAAAVVRRIGALPPGSSEHASLLPVAFRLFATAGEMGRAIDVRADMLGELRSAAITLYNRREYTLANEYIDHVLAADPRDWKMRLYRARIRIRQDEWDEADRILLQMSQERPGDASVQHAIGWKLLRQDRYADALDQFNRVLARRSGHVRSLRDAAECLYRLGGRNDEALRYLHLAKAEESENPYVLDLESRILEDRGDLEPAFESALLASRRDPGNAYMHTRLGVIRTKQGRPDLAINHFRDAVRADPSLYTPANSLAAAYLDENRADDAEDLMETLARTARTPAERELLEHTRARVAYAKGNLETSEATLKAEIGKGHNLVANRGLLIQVEIAIFDRLRSESPALAALALRTAEEALAAIGVPASTDSKTDSFRQIVAARRQGLGSPNGPRK